MSQPKERVTIVDTIEYEGLRNGQTYWMKGMLMNAENGAPILIDGKEVTAETAWIPEETEGEIEVTFQFDGSSLEGKTVVVFETIVCQGKEVAVHADLEDEG